MAIKCKRKFSSVKIIGKVLYVWRVRG